MDDDDFERLENLVEENNKLLKKIYRWIRIGRIFTFIYWVFIIGFVVGAFYFIQPFVESFLPVAQELFSKIESGLTPGGGTGPLDIFDIPEKIQGQ